MAIAGMMVVTKLEGPPYLCKTDEVGELCLSAAYTGSGFWGLQGVTNSQFKVSHSDLFLSNIIDIVISFAVAILKWHIVSSGFPCVR